jgi:hypothetical protein
MRLDEASECRFVSGLGSFDEESGLNGVRTPCIFPDCLTALDRLLFCLHKLTS